MKRNNETLLTNLLRFELLPNVLEQTLQSKDFRRFPSICGFVVMTSNSANLIFFGAVAVAAACFSHSMHFIVLRLVVERFWQTEHFMDLCTRKCFLRSDCSLNLKTKNENQKKNQIIEIIMK